LPTSGGHIIGAFRNDLIRLTNLTSNKDHKGDNQEVDAGGDERANKARSQAPVFAGPHPARKSAGTSPDSTTYMLVKSTPQAPTDDRVE